MSEIIFYDIPAKDGPGKAWSPNTWATRLALNYKGLKYRTEWVEYPDITKVCKEIGAEPTTVKSDGVTPHYTLPVIYDPSTKKAVSDSGVIAEYLDKTYPDTPRLFPPGTRNLSAAFRFAMAASFGGHTMHLYFLKDSINNLEGRGREYYLNDRQTRFGKKLEELSPEGEVREKQWKEIEGGLARMSVWLKAGPFLGDETICYADILLVSRLAWLKAVARDTEAWKKFIDFDNGRLDRYLQQFDKYMSLV